MASQHEADRCIVLVPSFHQPFSVQRSWQLYGIKVAQSLISFPPGLCLRGSVATSNYELFHHVIQRKQTSLGDVSHLLKLNAAKLRPSDTYGFSLYVIRLHSAKIRDKNGHLKALHSNVNCLQI